MERIIKKKGDKLCVKWKEYNNSLNSWIDKKDIVKMSEYFPNFLNRNPQEQMQKLNQIYLILQQNFTTGVDISDFAKKLKSDLANLKSNIDKLDIDRLKSVPSNLNNLKK